MKKKLSFLFEHSHLVTILFLSTLFGQFIGMAYLPLLPSIQHSLHIKSVDQIQLAMSFYLAGFLVPQLVAAYVSDFIGRRLIFLIGISLSTFAVLLEGFSWFLAAFFLLLFLTASGIGFVTTMNGAIVRDTFSKKHSPHIFAMINFAVGAGGIAAPLLSSFIGFTLGWRWVFFLLAGFGILTSTFALWYLRETHHPSHKKFNLSSIMVAGFNLLKNKIYVASALKIGITMAGLSAYSLAAPFMFTHLGYGIKSIGLFIMIPNVMMLLGIFMGSFLNDLLGEKILAIGNVLMIFSSLALFILGVRESASIYSILVPMGFFSVGVGMIVPYSWAEALASFGEQIATAAAFIVCIQNIIGVTVSLIVASFSEHTQTPLAILILSLALINLIIYIILSIMLKKHSKLENL